MTVLNLAIGAGADDGYRNFVPTYSNAAANGIVGFVAGAAVGCDYRFTGATGIGGSTINSATLSLYGTSNSGTPQTKVRLARADTSAQVSDAADFAGRTLTTAGVDWDGTLTTSAYNDKDITAPVQELADNHAATVAHVFHLDDLGSGTNIMVAEHFDAGNGHPPTLDIDYTAAATGNRRRRVLIAGRAA